MNAIAHDPAPSALAAKPNRLDALAAGAGADGDCICADRFRLDLDHADRGRLGDGDDYLHHRFRPDADIRLDGCIHVRQRRVHRAGRFCRRYGAGRAAGMDQCRQPGLESGGAGRGGVGGDAGRWRGRPGVRAGFDTAHLRPALEANPDDDGRHGGRRGIDQDDVGAAASWPCPCRSR